MSQDYHHQPGLFSFSNGFERSQAEILQQIRREKVPPPQLVAAGIQEEDNETSGMLSEMFKFQHSTHHMSLPNPSPTSILQGFHTTPTGGGHFSHFTWAGNDGGTVNAAAGEGQALSLSLSSSLHHLDAAKAGEEFRIAGDGTGMLFFGQGMASGSSEYPCKNNLNLSGGIGGGGGGGEGAMDQPHHIHVGFGSSIGVINGFRNSKYAKAAQELLEEFCSVVRGHHQFNKNNKTGSLNPNSNPTTTSDDGGDASNNNNNTPPLTAADRIEHQRRKVKLLAMLDEVDRRYNRYCEQMQMVVNSFDLMMGFGAAVPYTALAQKAMSRHFRCLKDAVAAQLKHSCEMLGEKDGGASGLTKGETPRLKMLEQSLRQQRAFHQMGMMEPEAWRPQRGLPERSVSTLRAWLFEHFLHPYPSDADKLMLARQTGLSRSQVSNWFINARVRLWKPMVEEMYQQEVKVDSENMDSPHSGEDTVAQTPTPNAFTNSPSTTTTTPPPPSAAAAEASAITTGKRSEINAAPESDPSLLAINTTQCFSENLASKSTPFNANVTLPVAAAHSFPTTLHTSGKADIESTLMRFGTNAAGNVSLTLGLRHAGNLPDKNHFFG